MEIVDYNEKKEILSVRYNTKVVWKYSKVSKEMYKKILESKSPDKFIRDIIHNSNIVGVVKEAV